MLLCENVASKEQFGSFKFEDTINVSLDLFICPCQYGSNGQIGESSGCSLLLYEVQQVCLVPAFVHEHDGLS